jgi:hypothetical protein
MQARGLEINAFSTEVKKIVAKQMGLVNYNNLNVYIKALKDKALIKKTRAGYKFHPVVEMLARDETVTIRFYEVPG